MAPLYQGHRTWCDASTPYLDRPLPSNAGSGNHTRRHNPQRVLRLERVSSVHTGSYLLLYCVLPMLLTPSLFLLPPCTNTATLRCSLGALLWSVRPTPESEPRMRPTGHLRSSRKEGRQALIGFAVLRSISTSRGASSYLSQWQQP